MADETSGEGAPEAPDWFKSIQWVLNYLSREGTVIKQAPVAFFSALAVASGITFFLLNWGFSREYHDREENHKATVESKDATIKSLEEAMSLQDKKLSAASTGVQILSKNDGARMERVASVVLQSFLPIQINEHFQNKGNAAAIGYTSWGEFVLSPKLLTDEELDFKFSETYKEFDAVMDKKATNELQPGETTFFTVSSHNITGDQFSEYMLGKGLLYLFIVSMYRDVNLPKDKWRVTEVCNFTVKGVGLPPGEGWHICNQHNRVFVRD